MKLGKKIENKYWLSGKSFSLKFEKYKFDVN